MSEQPKLLSMSMSRQALMDSNFYKQLPEFLPLRAKHSGINTQLESHGGCSGCNKRRVVANVFREFLQVVNGLDVSGKARLRAYFGASLIVSRQNPITKRVETIQI